MITEIKEVHSFSFNGKYTRDLARWIQTCDERILDVICYYRGKELEKGVEEFTIMFKDTEGVTKTETIFIRQGDTIMFLKNDKLDNECMFTIVGHKSVKGESKQ